MALLKTMFLEAILHLFLRLEAFFLPKHPPVILSGSKTNIIKG